MPRVEGVHDLEERGKVCACGAALSRIGQETSEQLDVIPAKVQVIRHLRYKYACKIRFYVWDSFINPLERGDGGVLAAHPVGGKFY